jgi:addiction module HigA family antidote
MSDYADRRYMMDRLVGGLAPMHPGELFREDILPALQKSKVEIAKLLAVSRQTLYDILAEKQDITPTMALRIGKLTGTSPEMWLNMQRNYDLRVQAEKDADILARIPTLEAA